MGRKNIIKSMKALSLALVLALAPVAGAQAASWGPARPTYTNNSPAAKATFNSITDNAAVGDERAFVRIAERGSGNKLVNSLRLEAGKQYVVSIYYHNDASGTTNVLRDAKGDPILGADGREQIGPGVALNVRMVSSFPTELKAGETGDITGKIISTNTTPQAVWASADVTAAQDMKIKYVENTAKIYNDWAANRRGVSRYLFSNEGAFIGLDDLNGVILGCDEYSGQVAYVLATEAVSTTPNPEPTPDPDPDPDPDPEPTPEPLPEPEPTPDPTPDDPTIDPEPEKPIKPVAPEELPETGPIEIILAVVVIGLIVAGIVYWRKTRAEVKKVTKNAKSKKR